MINLDDAITHCEEVAKEQEWQAYKSLNRTDDERMGCLECSKDHKQLADWLKCLKEIMDSGSCNDCEYGRKGYCGIEPKAGELARYNCYQYKRKKQGGGNDQR